MSISQIAREIREPATLRLTEAARLLRERGEPVIHLGAGEPKSKAPIDAILSSAAQLQSAEVRYTPTEGIPPLVKAIIRYMEENYGKVVSPEQVMVFTGAKQAIYSLMVAILNPQDEVVIAAPHWVSYPEITKMVYGKPVVIVPEDGGFIPTFKEFTEACSSYTKAIMINSPNNPSGAVYPAELIAELVEFCERKGIYLIMDDIYHRLTFDGVRSPNAYEYTTKDIDDSRVIVVNGVSKAYAMTGFRIGWTVASRKLTRAMVNIAAQNFSCPSVIDQTAAAGALTGVQTGVESLRLMLENNRNVMVNELQAFTGVKLTKPMGTFYCFPDFSAYSRDSIKLSELLLEKALVVTVPGVEFGFEGYLRLSFCGSVKDITEGIARIKWVLDPDSPNEIFIGDRKLKRDWL